MKRFVLVMIIVILAIIPACSKDKGDNYATDNNNEMEISSSEALQSKAPEVQTSAALNNQTVPPPSAQPYANDLGQYIFIREWQTTPRGLYRYDLDGSNGQFLVEGNCTFIGYLDDKIYFIDRDIDRLFKADADGKRRQAVVEGIAKYGIKVGDAIYFHNGKEIFRINKGGIVDKLADIPETIEKVPIWFQSDGEALYFVTQGSYMEGLHLYSCDIETGDIQLVREDFDVGFAIKDVYVYHHGYSPAERENIFRYNMETKENTVFYEAGEETFDIVLLGDWLIYITYPSEGFTASINWFNPHTGEVVSHRMSGDDIYEVTSDHVILYDGERLTERLIIEDGQVRMKLIDCSM